MQRFKTHASGVLDCEGMRCAYQAVGSYEVEVH